MDLLHVRDSPEVIAGLSPDRSKCGAHVGKGAGRFGVTSSLSTEDIGISSSGFSGGERVKERSCSLSMIQMSIHAPDHPRVQDKAAADFCRPVAAGIFGTMFVGGPRASLIRTGVPVSCFRLLFHCRP